MTSASRVILNTIILYTKIVVVMIINLWTVPLLLRAMGKSDYGLFLLIAGVIAMLAFLNAAMTVSTQRFMSITMGENDAGKLNVIYNVSIVLHVIIGVIVVAMLEGCAPFLFNGGLNIPEGRTVAAQWIYQFLVVSTLFTILAVPFDAVLNAHENMLVFSVISIIEAVAKLILALLLPVLTGDALIWYGGGWAAITIMGATFKYIYTRLKYRSLKPDYHQFDKQVFKEMFGFSGWNTFNALAIVGRNQGIAIILNLFIGTIANAAYGIANQINGLLSYFSATLQKSINPQLMKSEGLNDSERMLRIAFTLSKVSIFAISILAIPLIAEMPFIIKLWLKDEIPDGTIPFTRYILVVSIIFQMSAGLMSAIQSHGRIRGYTLTISAVLLLNIPVAYLILKLDYPPHYIMMGMIGIELCCFIVRLLYAYHLCQLNIYAYIRQIILPVTGSIVITSAALLLICTIIPSGLVRLCLNVIVSTGLLSSLTYFFVLSSVEQQQIKNTINSTLDRIKK